MIHALVAANEPSTFQTIERNLKEHYPQIEICGQAKSYQETLEMIGDLAPALLFMEVEMPEADCFEFLDHLGEFNFETILLASSDELALEAFEYQVSGFVLKPITSKALTTAIKKATRRINVQQQIKENQLLLKEYRAQMPRNKLLPVPTMDGYDFIPIQDIIRCEGFQRCTRIVTLNKSDIISSHHIGVFVQKLEKHHFFSTHKSHLINPVHIKKYYKEGTLQMIDDSMVPVSKRKKSCFVKRMIPR